MASSFVLLLFGLGYLVYNLNYSLDTRANPGPGIFPLAAGGVLVILSAYQLARALRRRRGERDERTCKGGPRSILELLKPDEKKPLVMIGLFVCYLLMIKWVGFFVSDFLFVVFCSRLIGARGWGRPLALSAGVNLFCYFLFEVWLKLSFPGGLLF